MERRYRELANSTLQELIKETEALLEKWKHPDPYRPPTAPGGEFGEASGLAADVLTHDRLQVRAQLAMPDSGS
jgi:hypothetical protein